MKEIIVDKNEVEVLGEYDVIVVGGGVAGVSAALSARRNGCSVLLIEKSVMLGGLGTLGLITYYEPLCDGNGRKIISGIAEELLHISIKYGYGTLSDEWKGGIKNGEEKRRYATLFSPYLFVMALDELMEKEGVEILFDTVFCKPIMEDGLCSGVIVENKSGRICYKAKMFVDASGDADLLYRAGAECVEGDNWLTYCAFVTDLEKMKKAVESQNVMQGIKYKTWGSDRLGNKVPQGSRKYKGTDGKEVTSFVMDGRRLLRGDFKEGNNFSRDLLTIPNMAQFRTTRRILGFYELTEKDNLVHFEDSVGSICDFSKAGSIYEIPYRTLISKGIKNIIAAGRIIASSGHAWEVTRVIPPASLTGQAAGAASALAIKNKVEVGQVSIGELQKNLSKAEVLIHF